MVHIIYSRAVYADMIASRPGPAEPEDRSLIVRAANRPRDVRDPERTVIESGVQSAPGNPVELIRSVSGASETVPSPTCRPGALMRMVASGLPTAGQDGLPPWSDDGRFLAITGLDNTRCQVTLNDDGEVLFEWWPTTGSDADPVRIAPLIRKILGEETDNWRPEWRRYCGLTLKSAIGRALKDSGLDVGMAVYDDPHNYEVFADVVVTSARHPECGKVRLNDDGVLTWEWESRVGASTAEAADRIVCVITSAISAGDDHA
jgi:hypothetical protein